MGLTAEALQQMYNISRQEQDEFSYRSQVLARKAIDAGYFVEEIRAGNGLHREKDPSY